MRLPIIRGLIKRRMLVNFRVAPEVMQEFLPAPFRPKLHDGFAIAGICLIRLEAIRPVPLPAALGVSSENAAHRIAVTWEDSAGQSHEGVFIPRRDTGSQLNYFAGGRLFPGEHHLANFKVRDDGARVDFSMRSRDKSMAIELRAADATALPPSSCFKSVEEASRFFEGGSLGYSVTTDPHRLDGLLLHTLAWRVAALEVEHVKSSLFSDESIFPRGTAEFDHALIMRDLEHEWHQAPDFHLEAAPKRGTHLDGSLSPCPHPL